MWIKRTEAELAEERRRQRRNHLRTAVLSGAFVLVLVMFFFGWGEGGRRGRVVVPGSEVLSRLPFAIVAAIVCSLAFYKCEHKRPTMICPKCEVTKYDDGVTQCSCGGQYEPMESMKHVS